MVAAQADVLVVGAGPTGLVLSLWLARLGVRVRVIDKSAEPGTTSRALAVQARILEQYDQLGLAWPLVERGLPMAAANLWVAGRKAGRAPFGAMGTGLSRFPFVLIYPQDEHERFLIERLRETGVEVERSSELTGLEDTGSHVRARLRTAGGAEQTCEAAYLVGCDGAHSRVRELLDTGFPGGTYAHLYYVADVEASGPTMDRELHVALDESDFLAVFPLAGPGRARLIGTVRQGAFEADRELAWEDVSKSILERMRISVERVNWFSTYHVHHRVARHFRVGRTFLAGDAAHIHSPVGGQGMNTGIGDAINLAWKLAAVLHRRADPKLLDSYEPERIVFARRLVASTDRAFTFVTRDGALARWVRLHVAPRLIPLVFSVDVLRRFMFRTVSQLVVNYRGGALSEGKAGRVKGGDRLPWLTLGDDGRDNFQPLKALDWQVHIYGECAPGIERLCQARRLPLHRFSWRREMDRAGLARDALYLVRPDGYIALADAGASAARLQAFLDARSLEPLAMRSAAAHPAPPSAEAIIRTP